MRQNIRDGSLDMITPGELSHALHEHLGTAFSKHLREIYRGMKVLKMPLVLTTASGTSVVLFNNPPAAQCGPESGYIWDVRRVIVASSVLTDTAKYALYAGSDASVGQGRLIDNGGSAGLAVNQAYYIGSKGLWLWPDEILYAVVSSATSGNQYSLTGVALEAPVEMQGKLMQ